MKTATFLAAAGAASVLAQRPTNTSICDYYTEALTKENTAANQLTVLTLVVNTAVIGNYSNMSMSAVNGILNPGMVNGTAVNLLPYFSGGLASTNRGDKAVSVNFLDGGGAAPLMKNMAANDTTSNQYKLLTHLYQFFGALLGCSAMDYPAYMGDASMASVHKFMDINVYENTYFIQQVGASAASFGVTSDDVAVVAAALVKYFNYRCSPEVTLIPSQGAQLQSICTAEDCPLDANATCSAYTGYGVMPMNATATSGSGSGSTTPSSSGTSSTPSFTGAASKAGYAVPAGLLAIAAFAL